MKLIYVDKDKGVTMLAIGGLLYGIYLMIIIIFAIISNIRGLPIDILELTRFVIFGRAYTIRQLWSILLLIYIIKVIDGFFDGLINSILNFILLGILYAFILNWGEFAIIFQYQSVSINIWIDFTLIIIIFLGLYVWVLLGEIWVLGIKSHAVAHFGYSVQVILFRLFRKPIPPKPEFKEEPEPPIIRTQEKEIKSNWIDPIHETILLEEDEAPLTENWVKIEGEARKNWFQFLFIDSLSVIFYGFLFALTTYLVSERGGTNLNSTVQAFFFPLWFILLTAYRSPANYVRAYLFLSISLAIQVTLFSAGWITVEAFFLLNFIIPISKWFLLDLSGVFAALTPSEVLLFVTNIMVVYMNIMFGIMIVYLIYNQFRSKKQIEILVSNKHLYIRRKRTYNQYDLVINILYAWIWPFNLAIYRDIWREFRYSVRRRQESLELEYGRLSFQNAVRKITKRPHKKWRFAVQAALLLSIGILTVQYQIGIPLIVWGFRQLYLLFKHKGIDIRVDFYRRHAEGSTFILSTENIFRLYELDELTAALIPAIQSYH
jgi:hypothetical protein